MKSGRRIKFIILIAAVLAALTLCFSACVRPASFKEPNATIAPPTAAPATPVKPVRTPAPTTVPGDTDFEIHFKDNFFHEAVCSYLGKGRYDPVYVSEVEHLTRFSARVCRISDIAEICFFKDLEDLDLYGNTITDLSPILTLTGIKTLNISKIFSVMDGADKRKGLDLAPLSGLVNLETLDASGNLISDVSALSGLTKLTRLDLSGNRITDASPLKTLVNLKWLDISNNIAINYDTNDEQGISDLLWVHDMKELTYLNAYNNVLESVDGLEGACKLETLDVRYNYIVYLDALMMSGSIKSIIASNNNLKSFGGLYGCSNLKTLRVENNYITDLLPLLNLTSLSEFTFSGNPVKDTGPYTMWKMMKGE